MLLSQTKYPLWDYWSLMAKSKNSFENIIIQLI